MTAVAESGDIFQMLSFLSDEVIKVSLVSSSGLKLYDVARQAAPLSSLRSHTNG